MEGIGHKFLPPVLDRSVVDEWVKCRDDTAFDMARRLTRTEGLLVGGSSGAVLTAAIAACKRRQLTKDQRCVVVLADGIRNYLTHFVSNDWMTSRGYSCSLSDAHQKWRECPLHKHLPTITTPQLSMSLEHGVKCMREHAVATMVIQDENS